MSDERRILLLAPGCDGTDVGESWSCFQWGRGLAEHYQVTLLTLQRPGREPIARQLPGIEVVAWPDLHWGGKLERFSSMLKPGYVRFFRQARRWIARSLRQGSRFDLIHQLGPLALRYPSPGCGFGIPLVMGPLAGSLETPPAFVGDSPRAPWYTRLRALDQFRLQHDPWLRKTYAAADVVLGVAPYVGELLAPAGISRFEVAAETGVYEIREPRFVSPSAGLKLLYVGRVVRTKGLRDAVRALSHLRDVPGVTLDAIGSGEDLENCRTLARQLQLEEQVRFHGRLSRSEVEGFYERSDVFLFPSFREPSGNVVFEALSHALPIITTNRGGPGYLVDEGSGIRVPAENPEQLSRDLAGAIRSLAGNCGLRNRLAVGAAARAAEVCLWSSKIDQMCDLYESVMARRGHPTGRQNVCVSVS